MCAEYDKGASIERGGDGRLREIRRVQLLQHSAGATPPREQERKRSRHWDRTHERRGVLGAGCQPGRRRSTPAVSVSVARGAAHEHPYRGAALQQSAGSGAGVEHEGRYDRERQGVEGARCMAIQDRRGTVDGHRVGATFSGPHPSAAMHRGALASRGFRAGAQWCPSARFWFFGRMLRGRLKVTLYDHMARRALARTYGHFVATRA